MAAADGNPVYRHPAPERRQHRRDALRSDASRVTLPAQSGCMSMRTSLEEGIKLHRFAGIFPEQFATEAGRHREAVVAADQRMVIRCFRYELAGFVHDVSHVPPPIQRAGLVDAPIDRALVEAMYPNNGTLGRGFKLYVQNPTFRGDVCRQLEKPKMKYVILACLF
jgi:hypothetical protein